MAKHPKPWYRKSADAWYVQVDGKQVLLAKGLTAQREAWAAFHRLRAGVNVDTPADVPAYTVGQVCGLYLDHCKATCRPITYRGHSARLTIVCRAFADVPVDRLTLSDVERWAAGLAVSSETKRDYLSTLRAALNWGRREGLHDADQLARLRLPPRTRRERTLAPAEREAIREAAAPALLDLLFFLEQTGCRPMMAAAVEARHVDWTGGTATVTSKGRPYPIVLTARLLARLRELADRHPTGPLLRNERGLPWTYNAVRCAFRRLRARTGLVGVSAYTLRHSYATDALERGVPVAALAELMNHRDWSMIARHYSHLAERRGALRAAAEAAAAAPGPPSPTEGRTEAPHPPSGTGSPDSGQADTPSRASPRGRRPVRGR